MVALVEQPIHLAPQPLPTPLYSLISFHGDAARHWNCHDYKVECRSRCCCCEQRWLDMARRSSEIEASVRRVQQGCWLFARHFWRCADSSLTRPRLENLKSEKGSNSHIINSKNSQRCKLICAIAGWKTRATIAPLLTIRQPVALQPKSGGPKIKETSINETVDLFSFFN